MDRRDFLKLAGFAGFSLGGGLVPKRAQAAPYDGLYWITVHAAGGWDPTSLCDPKGRANEMTEDPMNMYFTGDIQQAGNIRYAPVAGNQAFFEKHYQKLLVINGMDMATNGHDSGTRHMWSGRLAEGFPAFTAMVAGGLGRDRPLSFISNGGYDLTMGLVAPTRAGNTGVLSAIAYPNRMDTRDDDELYHTNETLARIQHFQRDRTEALQTKQRLPKSKNAISHLQLARVGENEIRRLTDFLPSQLDNSNNRLRRQAQLALAAYKAGASVSANLTTGGFDTHGDHDNRQFAALQRLTEGVDFLIEEAERQGVLDKVVICIGSDFGRTPGYNGQNGKDHWSVTSMMLMGPGIEGNRVIGSTDERHRPHTVDATTLARSDSGIRIKPGHVHRLLRRKAGMSGSELDRHFPITDGELALPIA